MERWLLISNCQTVGMANCLNLCNPGFEVVGVDIWEYTRNTALWNAEFDKYFRVVLLPEIRQVAGFDLSAAHNTTLLPPVYFDAYHPDICYLEKDGAPLKGTIGDYHSMIAVAAWNEGLSLTDACALFTGRIFERCGYMDVWERARAQLMNDFTTYGIDIGSAFGRWGLRKPFMYSLNHPRIEVLQDIAQGLMRSLGVPVLSSDLAPSDNLVNGPCWPVYPEIGEALGVEGSTLFKPQSQYRFIAREQFVEASFALYGSLGPGKLEPCDGGGRYPAVLAAIRGDA